MTEPVTGGRAIRGLVVTLVLCFAAAAIGGVATSASVTSWYPGLDKPVWTPPSWLFGPMWTLLYAMMAVAAWLVWKVAGGIAGAKGPLAIFSTQLLLNAAWSILFFGFRSPGLALLDIGLLWAAILATTAAFRRVAPVAGMLLVPYLLWVTFAAALNLAIWLLNR